MTISGWAKGVEYRPGAPITSGPINHSWNTVCIDGNWQLVDSHWATRYLQSEKNTPDNLVYEYDDFYFLPEPGNLVYSHCPEEPVWQLVYPAVGRGDYEDYPLVKSFFFNIGMLFLQQNQGVVYTRHGLVTLTLGYSRPTAFTFKLVYGDHMLEAVQGIQLKRYIIQETTDDRVTIYLRAPREGNYFLTLFAQPVGEKVRVENVFKATCEYKIVCNQAAGDIRPYPLCSDSNWGPGSPVRQYGLVANHKTAILAAPNGQATVSFTKTRDVRLFARLMKDGMTEDALEQCVTVDEQDNQIFVTVRLPVRGEYGLEIYANEMAREGDTFTHMCQYLVTFTDRDLGSVYGQVFDRSDLAYGTKASPMIYSAQGDQYASPTHSLGRDMPIGQQYASNTRQYPGGPQQYPGGVQQYPAGSQQYPTGQDRNGQKPDQYSTTSSLGRGSAYPDQYNTGAPNQGRISTGDNKYATAAPTYGRPGEQSPNRTGPGGKQVYQTGSQDWDGETFTKRSYHEEKENTDDGSRSYKQVSGVCSRSYKQVSGVCSRSYKQVSGVCSRSYKQVSGVCSRSYKQVSGVCSRSYKQVSGVCSRSYKQVSGVCSRSYKQVSGVCSRSYKQVSGVCSRSYKQVSGVCSRSYKQVSMQSK